MSEQAPDGFGERLPALELHEQDLVKPEQKQALFLNTGQVYFGNLWVYPTGYAINNIYYLQGEGENQKLIKLGEEVHGPEDAMFVPRTSVSFWENLRQDGNVSKAIENYEAE